MPIRFLCEQAKGAQTGAHGQVGPSVQVADAGREHLRGHQEQTGRDAQGVGDRRQDVDPTPVAAVHDVGDGLLRDQREGGELHLIQLAPGHQGGDVARHVRLESVRD